MNQEQNDEFSMLKDLQGFFNIPGNAAKIATVPALVTAKGELDTNITTLEAKKVISDSNDTGIAGNKGDQRVIVQEKVLVLTGPLANLGRTNNDNVLKNRYKIAPSTLDDLRENDLVTFATQTVTDATSNLLALAGSGITLAKVTAVTTANAAFSLAIATPGQARQAKKVANQTIKATFPITRELIEISFTPLMRSNFAATDPDFFNTYLESTLITTTGNRHFDFFGMVIDNAGNFVQKVLVEVLTNDVSKTLVIKTKTGPKGRFSFKEIPQGTYIVRLSRPGYQTQEITGIAMVDGVSLKKIFTIIP
jgi:hypothetical protein